MPRSCAAAAAAVLLLAVLLAATAQARPALHDHQSTSGVAHLRHHLFRQLRQGAGQGGTDQCFACANCAMCREVKTLRNATGYPTGFKEITIDASACKGDDLSWMCCRGAKNSSTADLACTLKTDGCDAKDTPSYEYGKNKCDTVQAATYVVPSTATNLTVQVHDGKASGTKNCGASVNEGLCCGGFEGSCGGTSGVCEWVIDLSSCPDEDGPVGQNPCDDCTAAGDCEVAECIDGQCIKSFLPNTIQCRAATDDCDEPAKCTGSSAACQANPFKDHTVQCRAATDVCDEPAKCTGSSAACPANPFKDNTVTCRESAGVCDVEEKCTGNSAACPADDFKPNTATCRASAGICDVEEKCTGSSAACPTDVFLPSTTVCRASAGDCDVAENCTGSGALCPADAKRPHTDVCREAKDLCDKPEFCTGTGNDCPTDEVLRDKAKVFKCGRVCYLCGMPTTSIGAELNYLQNTWALGSCNTGNCDSFQFIKDPTYCGDVLPLVCPNGKALSNVIHGTCVGSTGKWSCLTKQDAPFSGPVRAPWAGP